MSMQSSYDLAKPSDTTSEPHSPGRVLIVASDDFLRKSWSERLLSSHWKTREARSGTQALELLFEEVSELLLLDRNLPDLDPDEFESMVREQFPGIQIVELASASQTEREGFASPAVSLQTHNNVPRFAVRSREMCAPVTSSPGEVLTRLHELVGESGAMQKVYRAAQLVASATQRFLFWVKAAPAKTCSRARSTAQASERSSHSW